MGNLLQELKRRKVFRVAAVYAVVAWLLIQVVDVVLPTFDAPQWVSQTIMLVLLLGLPVAVVLAWAFDITPDGIQKTESMASDDVTTLRKRDYVFSALVLMLVGVVVVQQFGVFRSVDTASTTDGDITTITSLAVLPFVNLMNDPSQDYFADGMTDAVIHELGTIKALKVISRTTAMRYKETDKSIPQIAEELGVDAVIEGSVFVEGNTVKVTVRLTHGASDAQIWTESYTITYESILKLHSDVALAIADAISIELTGDERIRIAAARTVVPAAYEAYLLGEYSRGKLTREGITSAIELYTEATKIDPEFADAWAGLGFAYLNLQGWGLALATTVVRLNGQSVESYMKTALDRI